MEDFHKMEDGVLRNEGWRGWRDGLFRRVADALADDYAGQVEHFRALGHGHAAPRRLSAELEVGSGLLVAQWQAGSEPRADAWGRREYLPGLSLWLSERLARHGLHRVAAEAERRVRASDREDEAYRLTEEMLSDSRLYS